jgi:hypothetical protein
MTLPTLADVAKDMATWRQTRLKRGTIPLELQVKISSLASRYRISEITKALGINTAQIKVFHANSKKIPTPSTPVNFIRLSYPQALSKIQCQLKRTDGAILECTLDPSQLNKLVEAFLC